MPQANQVTIKLDANAAELVLGGLEELRAVSEQMLDEAKMGAWEEVERLEADRQSMMQDLFGGPIPGEVADQVATRLQEVLGVNEQVIDLIKHRRDDVAQIMRGVQTGKRARRAYGG
jgi:hypothetical protein